MSENIKELARAELMNRPDRYGMLYRFDEFSHMLLLCVDVWRITDSSEDEDDELDLRKFGKMMCSHLLRCFGIFLLD